ncbi:MAG: glycogen-debranching protein, partial [Myxococcales bacterium]|nr:glycogen-debranching protein [Myxococcales bacterium]
MTRATHAPHPVSLAVLAALLAVAACEPPPDEAVDTEELSSVALGAYYVGQSVHFEVYSAHATRVEVWLYSTALGAGQKGKVTLTHSGDRWYANVPLSTIQGWGITGTIYYGYRAWGPNWTYSSSWSPGSSAGFVTDVDAQGNRFNPNKLLFDPYALELSHDPINMAHTDGTVFASGPSYRLLDSGPYAPKGIVMTEPGIYSGSKPTRAFKDEVIYEVHVRGLTKNDTSIASAYRGTYRGAGLKAAALASLGITAVEFLPVQETDNDANDYDPSTTTGDNYWGYM